MDPSTTVHLPPPEIRYIIRYKMQDELLSLFPTLIVSSITIFYSFDLIKIILGYGLEGHTIVKGSG